MLRLTENTILRPAPTDEQRQLRERTTLLRRTKRRELVTALHRRNAVADIETLPGAEESLHIIARGNFPLWSIVPAVLALAAPATITALDIATLGFSKANITDLLALIDAGQIKQVAIVASIYFERQSPAEYQLAVEGFKARGQTIIAPRNHAKVIAMAMDDGRRFVVESSANLRSCRNIEQIVLTQSRALHEFHAGWIHQVVRATAAASAKPKRKRARK